MQDMHSYAVHQGMVWQVISVISVLCCSPPCPWQTPRAMYEEAHGKKCQVPVPGTSRGFFFFIQEVPGILLCGSVCLFFSFHSYRRFSFFSQESLGTTVPRS